MNRYQEDKLSGLQKSAILLIALGPEKSAAIFKHLKEEEIEELTLEIANTRSITPQIKDPGWRLMFQGPGNGITLTDGTMVFPAQFRVSEKAKLTDTICYTNKNDTFPGKIFSIVIRL